VTNSALQWDTTTISLHFRLLRPRQIIWSLAIATGRGYYCAIFANRIL